VRVLMLGSGPRMMNAARMLESLGVASAFLDDSGTDVGLLRRLSRPDAALPVCGGSNKAYTHCIHSDIVPDRDIAMLQEKLPVCRFACLRSILNSMQEPHGRDTMLFNPLLITDLAKFLNKGALGTSGRIASPGTIVSARLLARDATALVVDDNRINLLVCEKMLSVYGLEVRTASGGEEALALCRETKFDILFVDHMMPEMDGIEVTAEIRGNPGLNRKTPIVALTANVINDMRNYYIKCGMDDFVGKPIDSKELVRVLTQWLPAKKLLRSAEKDIG
jgi:CheY-like chemotaxis protein